MINLFGLRAYLLIILAFSTLFFAVPQARADNSCADNFADSGIVSTGGSVAIVASDNLSSGGNLNYFWQKTGTSTWHRELVAEANGGSCPGNCIGWCPQVPWGYLSNAIAWTGQSVIIAGKDQRDGGLYFWWQEADNTIWHQQTVAAGPPGCCAYGSIVNGVVTTTNLGYSMPSLAWTGRSAVIAACDEAGNLQYWYQNKGQTTWFHEHVASDGCKSQPSIAWTGTSVVIAAACNQSQASMLCYYWQQAGTGTWTPQVVDNGLTYAPSIGWTGNAVVIAAEQAAASDLLSIAYWWQAAGTGTWHKQLVYGPPTRSDFSPTPITAAGGSVVIAAGEEGLQTNRLDYWWQPATSSGSWALENPSGPGDYTAWTDPGSIAWTGLSLVISSTTACGDLDYWWQQAGSGVWHKERIVTNEGWPPGTC
jgi:hypothetical protein